MAEAAIQGANFAHQDLNTHSHSDGSAFGSNLVLSVLLKDTSTCDPEQRDRTTDLQIDPTPTLILHRSSPEHKQRLNSRNGTGPTVCLGTCGEPIEVNVLTVTQPLERGGKLFYCMCLN